VLLHIKLHCHQVSLCIRLSTARDQLSCNTDGAVAEVVGAALHLLGVSVEVVPADGDADEQVAVLHVVDVDVPGVLPTGDGQGAQDSGIVATLIGHLGDCQAINHVQIPPSTHFVPPAQDSNRHAQHSARLDLFHETHGKLAWYWCADPVTQPEMACWPMA
jgi:hypothetical protein